MSTKRLIKVRSQFEDGYLKSFELISVTPRATKYESYDYVSFNNTWTTYFDDVLWINTNTQQHHKYVTAKTIDVETYRRYLARWNDNPYITVIDTTLGEL